MRHRSLEKGSRLLFLSIIRRFPISFLNGKERAKIPSLKNGVCLVFSPVVTVAYRLLGLTKTRGWHNINLIFTNI
jgi:hypothetical protein